MRPRGILGIFGLTGLLGRGSAGRSRQPSPANLRAEAVVARRRAYWANTPIVDIFTRQQRRAIERRAAKARASAERAWQIKLRRARGRKVAAE